MLAVVLIALLPFVAAQANDTTLQLKAIEAHFTQSQIVPSLLASFEPSALLTVNYPGVGEIAPGQKLTKEQSGPAPTITVTPANSTVDLTGHFTVAMVDADIVGSDLSKGENRHWLVNGAEISNNEVSLSSATSITKYAGPGPAAGSGPHRYVIILYRQPDSFTAPPGFSEPIGVTLFDINAYAKDGGLGPIVAATYITVEEGTSTLSIPATSPVVTSTLAPASSGTSPTSSSTKPTDTTKSPNNANKIQSYSVLTAILASLIITIA